MANLFSAIANFFTSIFDSLFSQLFAFGKGLFDIINQGTRALGRLVEFFGELFRQISLLQLVPWPAFVSLAFGAVIALVAVRLLIDLL